MTCLPCEAAKKMQQARIQRRQNDRINRTNNEGEAIEYISPIVGDSRNDEYLQLLHITKIKNASKNEI